MDILHAIGNTSIVQLQKVVPPQCAAIFVKLEWQNPTGSMKDRMAQSPISHPEADGRLKTYWTDQLHNPDGIAGYYPLGEEIWTQTQGKVDAFVHSVGTAASSRGVATVLKRHKTAVRIAVVEPGESAVLAGGEPGPHNIEGIGIGYTPPLWEPSLVDELVPVDSDDAKEMARRLAKEEGLFGGTWSGANVVAAIGIAQRLGPGATVVTLMADSGLKYLRTDVYRRS